MPARRSAQTATATVPAPAPVLEEPELDLDALEDAIDKAEQVDDVEVVAPAPAAPTQKIFKLTQFIKDLIADHPEARRFDIYFFTDRIHKISNPWSDQAANIS
jgi:hypothetical protein